MKILFAEDTKDLRKVVGTVLRHENYDVDLAFDGQDALDHINRDSYDCIILDIMMPRKDGIEVLREIRSRHILTPVILLTAKTEIDDRVAGLDAGADDYLPKPFAIKELLARIRSQTRRADQFSGRQISFGNIVLNAEDLSMTAENSVRLSIKEFELIQMLAVNRDKALTTAYILDHIWKNEGEAGEDTVWLYISYLKAKLRAIGTDVFISGERGGAFRLENP